MKILFPLFLLCISLVVVCVAQGRPYEVTGTVSYDAFVNTKQVYKSRMQFRVLADGCKWLISTTDTISGNAESVGFEDGVSYRLNSWLKDGSNTYAAVIEAVEVPVGDESAISYLWLAYASSCHFANLQTNRLMPVWIMDDPHLRDDGFNMEAKWNLANEPPYLPLRVEYRNDGLIRAYSRRDNERFIMPYRQPYSQGFINAVYEATVFTNWGGNSVPTKFVFTTYAVPSNITTNESVTNLLLRNMISVADTSLSRDPKLISFRPQFSATLRYTDKRFIRSNPAVANVPNMIVSGQWPEITPELAKEAKLRARVEHATERGKSKSKSRIKNIIAAVTVFTTVGLIVICFRAKVNKNQKIH